MNTSKRVRTILAAVIGAIALSATSGAIARDHGEHEGHRGHGWGHYKHHQHYRHRHEYRHHEVIRERIVIHEPPPVYYERRVYYGSPAVVIGIDIPPLVLPLR